MLLSNLGWNVPRLGSFAAASAALLICAELPAKGKSRLLFRNILRGSLVSRLDFLRKAQVDKAIQAISC